MANTERIYGLDILRGISMILGIFLHGAIAYKAGYPYGELIHDTGAEFYFYDWMHLFINSFRMQLFFLLAGFFCSLVIKRKGLIFFSKNRFTRIVIPLLLAYFTILPATLVPVVYYQHMAGNPWQEVIAFLKDFYSLKLFSGLIHLWFLYNLIIFYVGVIVSVLIMERWGFPFTAGNYLNKIMGSKFMLWAIVLTGLISQLYALPVFTIWTGLRPPLAQLFYYGFFFLMGLYLENNRQRLGAMGNSFLWLIAAGFLLSLVNFTVLNFYLVEDNHQWIIEKLYRFSLGCQSIFIVFGLIGLFYSKFLEPSETGKYLARSSYWVYLIHNPVVLFMQLILLESVVPATLRFPVVLIVSTIVSYASYNLFVRKTWIGLLLNGK